MEYLTFENLSIYIYSIVSTQDSEVFSWSQASCLMSLLIYLN